MAPACHDPVVGRRQQVHEWFCLLGSTSSKLTQQAILTLLPTKTVTVSCAREASALFIERLTGICDATREKEAAGSSCAGALSTCASSLESASQHAGIVGSAGPRSSRGLCLQCVVRL
jgi:hypothetical protein